VESKFCFRPECWNASGPSSCGALPAAIHRWATNLYVAHKFRHLAGNIFDRFKTQADAVLARLWPDAIAKLGNAVEKAGPITPRTGQRRRCHAVACSITSPMRFTHRVMTLWTAGVSRRTSYKNRLWAFAKERRARPKTRRPRNLFDSEPSLVAGAGYAECYTAPETYWIDLR
jgi:hypothetical protein